MWIAGPPVAPSNAASTPTLRLYPAESRENDSFTWGTIVGNIGYDTMLYGGRGLRDSKTKKGTLDNQSLASTSVGIGSNISLLRRNSMINLRKRGA